MLIYIIIGDTAMYFVYPALLKRALLVIELIAAAGPFPRDGDEKKDIMMV
jgi:hypothetical protein